MTETLYKVTELTGGRASSQSGAGEMDFATDQGPITLQLDAENLNKILGLAIHLVRIPAPEPGRTLEVRAFETAWWTLGRTPDNRDVVLTFEIAQGGHIGFRIPMEQAGRLYDAMATSIGRAPTGQIIG
jgi:hypothetical protein